MSVGLLPVARKAKDDGGGNGSDKAPRKPRGGDIRPIALTIRGRAEWKEWVAKLAAADRASLNELVDRSLARYAREIGFKEAPPER